MMLRKPLNQRLPSTQNHKTPNQHRFLPNSQTSIDRTEKGYLADSTPVAPGFHAIRLFGAPNVRQNARRPYLLQVYVSMR